MDAVIQKLEQIELLLKEVKAELFTPEKQDVEPKIDYLEEITELRQLFRSNQWPLAVKNNHICRESDKLSRAERIIEVVTKEKIPKTFLDFHCGEGWTIKAIENYKPELAVGYDINPQKWDQFEEQILTTDLTKVVELAPYDTILMFDVLDHINDPVSTLKQIYNLLALDGLVFIRCHPWSSRHATHLFEQKAFAHLVFTESELKKMGETPRKCPSKVTSEKVYRQWFREAGFRIKSVKKEECPIEEFFTENEFVKKRIEDSVGHTKHLNIEYIDYILA